MPRTNLKEKREEIINEFKIEAEDLEPFDLLLYSYDIEGYEGYAFGLLESKTTGELFTFEGSH